MDNECLDFIFTAVYFKHDIALIINTSCLQQAQNILFQSPRVQVVTGGHRSDDQVFSTGDNNE